jgi:hypothetical protein
MVLKPNFPVGDTGFDVSVIEASKSWKTREVFAVPKFPYEKLKPSGNKTF